MLHLRSGLYVQPLWDLVVRCRLAIIGCIRFDPLPTGRHSKMPVLCGLGDSSLWATLPSPPPSLPSRPCLAQESSLGLLFQHGDFTFLLLPLHRWHNTRVILFPSFLDKMKRMGHPLGHAQGLPRFSRELRGRERNKHAEREEFCAFTDAGRQQEGLIFIQTPSIQ